MIVYHLVINDDSGSVPQTTAYTFSINRAKEWADRTNHPQYPRDSRVYSYGVLEIEDTPDRE